MKSTDVLKHEHEVIERVLTLLEEAAARLRRGGAVADGFTAWAIGFIREFADRCHHGKEEEVLFPLLERRGVPRTGGPIGCMLNEHVQGRELVARMSAAADHLDRDTIEFASAAEEYVALLRQHIYKENNVLFAMADRCMSTQDDDEVDRGFMTIEQRHSGGQCHHRFETEVAKWEIAMLSADHWQAARSVIQDHPAANRTDVPKRSAVG